MNKSIMLDDYLDNVDLGLSKKTKRFLTRRNIYKIKDFLEFVKDENLQNIPGIGNKTEKKVIDILKKEGIPLEEYNITIGNKRIHNNINIEGKNTYEIIEDLDISTRAYRVIKRRGINTVPDLAKCIKEGNFKNGRGLGDKTKEEIFLKLKEIGVLPKEYDIILKNKNTNLNKDVIIKKEELSELEKLRKEKNEYVLKLDEVKKKMREIQGLLNKLNNLIGNNEKE